MKEIKKLLPEYEKSFCLKAASEWFEKEMEEDFEEGFEGERVLDIVENVFDKKGLERFYSVGYFPGGSVKINEFIDHMLNSGFEIDYLVDNGILKKGNNVIYSPLEGRIIFTTSIKMDFNKVVPNNTFLVAIIGYAFKEGDLRKKFFVI